MKKITFIQTSYSVLGGIETWSKGLGNYFFHKGHKVSYVCAYEKTQEAVFGFSEKSSTNTVVKLCKLFSRAFKIRKYIINQKPTHIIVSVDNMIISTALALMLIPKTKRPKAYAVIHQQIATTNHINRCLFKKALRVVAWDQYIGVSEGIASELRAYVKEKDSKRVVSIYNFVEEPLFIKDSLFENFISQVRNTASKLAISVGRLAPIKGYVRLVVAWKKVVDVYPEVKLVIIGEGEDRVRIEKQIKLLGLGQSIYLIGERKYVYPYIQNADLYVCSSYSESFGLSMAQAMSLGKPVVSIDCDFGPRELFDSKEVLSSEKYPFKTKYGYLVNEASLSEGVLSAFNTSFDSDQIKGRAEYFNLKTIGKSWDDLLV